MLRGNKVWDYFKTHPMLLFLLLTLCTMIAIFSPFIFGDKIFIYQSLGSDSLWLYWPTSNVTTDLIRTGNGGIDGWGWQYGLGTSVVAASTMTMMDPFTLFLLPFDTQHISTGYLITAIIKLTICSLMFFKCLQWRGFSPKTCILIGLIFAVNSYAIAWSCLDVNLTAYVYMVGIIFGYEYYRMTQKGHILSLFVFLQAIQTPYYLYIVLIFIVLTAIIDCIFRYDFKQSIKFLLKGFLFIIAGVALAAFAFIPHCYVMLSNPRVDGSVLPSLTPASLQDYAGIFLRLFNAWGGFANYTQGGFFSGPLFCASTIALLSTTQLFDKKLFSKKILLVVILIALALFFVNITLPIMNGFSQKTYRWSWMLLIPILYGAAKVFTNYEREKYVNIKIALFTVISVLALWIPSVLFSISAVQDQFDVNLAEQGPVIFANIEAFGIFVLVLVSLIVYKFSKKTFTAIIVAAIVVAEVVIMPAQILSTRAPLNKESYLRNSYYDVTIPAVEKIKEGDSGWYRVDKDYDTIFLNDAFIQGYEGIKSYIQHNNPYYIRFSKVMGAGPYYNFIYGFNGRHIIQSILGVKYLISKENKYIEGFDLLYNLGDVFVYKNRTVLPMGFMYYDYMDEQTFLNMDAGSKEIALTSGAVLKQEDSDIKKYSGDNENAANNLERLGGSPFLTGNRTKNSIEGTVNAKENGVLFFSIPYDKGWSAYVDGVEAPVDCVNIGFCGLHIDKGEHTVVLKFMPVGLNAGLWISILSAAGILIYILLKRKHLFGFRKRPQ